MKSQKGITLTSLAIYIMVVLVVLGILGTITISFRRNINDAYGETSRSLEIDRFNVYFLKEVKKDGNSILSINSSEILFSTNNKYTFKEESIYLNDNIKIAENISNCEFSQSLTDGKIVITVKINAEDGEERTVEYVLNSEKNLMSYEDEEDYLIVASQLPKEYQQLEYIQNTGKQYIDTGVKGASNIKIKLTGIFKPVVGASFITGSRNQGRTNVIAIFSNPDNYDFQFDKYQYYDYAYFPTDDMTTLELSKDGAYMNNELVKEVSQEEWQCNLNIAIFAVNTNGSIQYGNGHSIYSYKIYENNILIRDFIPCYRKVDNVIGMYDVVNDVFYTNKGTEDFVAGPEK